MSLHPDKKSDLEKGWMKKRRNRAIKVQPEYHLIVTEGTDTETLYFEAIRDTINRNREIAAIPKRIVNIGKQLCIAGR